MQLAAFKFIIARRQDCELQICWGCFALEWLPAFPKKRGILHLIFRKPILQCLGLLIFLGGIPCQSVRPAETPQASQLEYRLRLYHTHTNERIDIVYRRGDQYIPSAVARLDQFLRDHRTGDVMQLDVRLFDLLHDLASAVGQPNGEIDIVCGYRTPWSNEFLRRTTSGVAANSLHMAGEAIDIRVPGVAILALRNAALLLRRGGVGYYPESRFVHVDVGRIRHW
jgi:uncharacterized protein YcbK (DUF882 family)